MQTQIQFSEMLMEIDSLKTKRREWLKKTHHFHSDEINFLLRVTYELTDKDFEYFVAYILNHEWFTGIDVRGWKEDGGADVVGKKNWKFFFIQCKQWASSYISMKRAGEFYGTIYPLKKKNPEAIIAYVTTSYINDEVLDFFHIHGIDWTISNGKLLDSCRELWLFTEEWWGRMIWFIKQQRILELRKELQTFIPLESELRKLQRLRVDELRNHLQPSKHTAYINSNSIDYTVNFFKYWNLV